MIVRVEKNKDNPYVMMNKAGLNDPRLSFKAKGILAYLLSKPDDWQVRVKDLANHSADGSTAVRSGLKELIQCGYAEFRRTRDDQTKAYISSEYIVYEVPRSAEPHAENLNVGKPNEANPHDTNNDSLPSNDVTDSAADAATAPRRPSLFSTLAKVCRYDLKLITKAQRGQLNQTEKKLRTAGVTDDALGQFGGWWQANDWRGKKGEAPKPHQVREEWARFTDWRRKNGTHGGDVGFAAGLGKPITAENVDIPISEFLEH